MDAGAVIRMLASLGLVLGLLAAALWAVRRFGLVLPGRTLARGRLQLVERLSLDPKRSLVLVRRDGCEHLLLLGPEGPTTIETAIQPPTANPKAAEMAAPEPQAPPTFASLLAKTIKRPGVGRLGLTSIPAEVPCAAD